MVYEWTNVHVDDCHEGIWATHEANADARGEDLGEAVEADYPPNVGLLELKGEV